MSEVHGIIALFPTAERLLTALRRLRDSGYAQLEVYTPWPVEEAYELLPRRRSPIPLIMLCAGVCGLTGAFLLQVWASFDYPLNVAGRPLFSWPAYIPVTFELTILTTAFCGLIGFLIIARLPRLDHPVFAHSSFQRASQDAFFICVRASDPLYDHARTADLLRAVGAREIEEVMS